MTTLRVHICRRTRVAHVHTGHSETRVQAPPPPPPVLFLGARRATTPPRRMRQVRGRVGVCAIRSRRSWRAARARRARTACVERQWCQRVLVSQVLLIRDAFALTAARSARRDMSNWIHVDASRCNMLKLPAVVTGVRPTFVATCACDLPGEPWAPGEPFAPPAPPGPALPGAPRGPSGPLVPAGPLPAVGPRGPVMPWKPARPAGPIGPGWPMAPAPQAQALVSWRKTLTAACDDKADDACMHACMRKAEAKTRKSRGLQHKQLPPQHHSTSSHTVAKKCTCVGSEVSRIYGPGGPVGPNWPSRPVAPVRPGRPAGPCGPKKPGEPVCPATPEGPGIPM